MAAAPNWFLAVHVACLRLVAAREARFLIITSPTTSMVHWQALETDFGDLLKPQTEDKTVNTLIDGIKSKCIPMALGAANAKGVVAVDCDKNSDQGLQTPTGIALHSAPSQEIGKGDVYTLYVSDAQSWKIFAYPLVVDGTAQTISTGPQREILQVPQNGGKWLTADSYGNLYYTAPDSGEVPGAKVYMLNKTALDEAPLTTPVPHELYATATTAGVTKQPGGIAVDSFFLYWANEDEGALQGSIVKAHDSPKPGTAADANFPMALAKNSVYTYGVCLARDSVFYTAQETNLYAVKKAGGIIAEVSTAFKTPRGCAFDGVASLLVADESLGYVYSLPSNMKKLRAVKKLSKVVKVTKPVGIVVLQSGAPRWGLAALAAALAAAALGDAIGR